MKIILCIQVPTEPAAMEQFAANRSILTSWSPCPAWVTSPAETWAMASTAVLRRSMGRWMKHSPVFAAMRIPILLHQPPPPPGDQELVQFHPPLWSSLQWCWWASWWSGGWCLWGNKWQFSSDLCSCFLPKPQSERFQESWWLMKLRKILYFGKQWWRKSLSW